MADNKRRGRFGRGSDDDAPQSIFDLFEPPPEQDAASFTRIPIIRDDADVELDLTDNAMVEAQVAADVEAAGLAHWTEPPTGQVPKSLASAVAQDDKWADVRGPSWQGEEPNWAGPDLSDVFADTEAISHRRVVETDDEDLRGDPTSTMPLPGRQLRGERPAPGGFDADGPGQPRVSPPPPASAGNGFDPRRPGAGTPPAPSVFGDQPAVAGRPAAAPPGSAAFDDRPAPRLAAPGAERPAPAAPSAFDPRVTGRAPGAGDRPPADRGAAPSAFDAPLPPAGRGVSAFDERQAAAGRGVSGFDERQAAAGRGVPGLDSRRSPRGRSGGFDEQPPAQPGSRSVFDERRRLGAPPPPAPAARPSPPPAPAARPAPQAHPGPDLRAQPGPGPDLRAGGPGLSAPGQPGPGAPGPVGGRLQTPDHNPAGGPPPARPAGPGPAPGGPRRPPAPEGSDAGRGRPAGIRLEGGDSPVPPGGPSMAPPPPARRGAHDAPPAPGSDPALRSARVPMPDRGAAPTRAMPQPQSGAMPPGPVAERNGRFDPQPQVAQRHPLDDPAGRFEAGPPPRRQAPPPEAYDEDEGYDLDPTAVAPAGPRGRERREGAAGGVGQRVAVGVALIALVAVALGLGPAMTMLLVGLITLLAVMELFNTMRIAGLRPATLLGLVGAVALPAAAYVRGETGYPLVIGLAVIFGMLWYLTGADTERPVLNLGLTFLGVLWVGGLAGFAALMLRAEESIQLLATTIAITAISDTFAYFGGRAYGTKPFHPASPKKTWEGTITGFFGALLTGLVIGVSGQLSLFDGHFTAVMALAALVGILAPIGDLAESLVKRDLGVKDMGTLLPGHGGVLDRIDGLLFALPGAYYMAVIFGLF